MLGRRGSAPDGRAGVAGNLWLAGAAVIVLLGVAGSVLGARAVARSDERSSQRALVESSVDLVVDLSAFIVATPTPSNAEFNAWLSGARAFARYPEILGIARIVLVPAAGLPAYAARAVRDPAGPLAADGTFQVVPPGKRPFYCFVDLVNKSLVPSVPVPAGTDYCAGTYEKGLLAGRDTGMGAYQPYTLGPLKLLAIQTPVYRGGVVPKTVAARRAAFIGWTGIALAPGVMLSTALQGQPQLAVALSYRRGSSSVTFHSGDVPPGATSLTSDLHNGWTVRTLAAPPSHGLFSHGNSIAVLAGGGSVSILLGLLGFVLVTGRARAVRLVHEQTEELRGQSEQLRRNVDELRVAQAIKDEFISLVSHELRTPLTSISGFTEMLQEEEELTDEQREYLGVIAANSARLLSIVDDLLLMAQIQSGGVPLQIGEVMLNDLIAHSGEVARPLAARKDIDVGIDAEPGVATQGDPARLGQVVDNLLSNAIKYTPEGGEVSITMRQTGETATIAIRDSGIGIPAEEQAQLFSRFFRSSNARASGVQGTGLGLAITRGIVEAHGGTIDFDSVEGAGTTFRVTLPRAHRVEAPAG